MTAADPILETTAPAPAIARLGFIEGLRGLAALVVCVGHFLRTDPGLMGVSLTHASIQQLPAFVFWPGAEMVNLFLLVSGFSLAYSEDVRRALGRPATTLNRFIRRRSWRIGPTYYVALVFGMAVAVIVPMGALRSNPLFAVAHPTVNGILAHLALVHNLSSSWQYQGNAPLWSMAFEAQLYLLFPLLYAGMRRWHPAVGAVAAIGFDVAVNSLWPAPFPIFGLLRWFALGMLLAAFYRRLPARSAGPALAVGLVALAVAGAALHPFSGWAAHDLLWAVAFAGIVLWMTQRPFSRWNPCNGRALRWMGMRSYSLYALHYPLVVILAYAGLRGYACAVVGVPLAIVLAEVGFRVVEKPSLRRVKAV